MKIKVKKDNNRKLNKIVKIKVKKKITPTYPNRRRLKPNVFASSSFFIIQLQIDNGYTPTSILKMCTYLQAKEIKDSVNKQINNL